MNETATNFFEAIERPLTPEHLTIHWHAPIDPQRLDAAPSTLDSLWQWSLQFDVPLWLLALLALGLAVVVAWEVSVQIPHIRRRAELRANRRAHNARSVLH